MKSVKLIFLFLFVCVVSVDLVRSSEDETVTVMDVVKKIYHNCFKLGSFTCVKPKVLGYLSQAIKQDKILVTRDLSIVSNGKTLELWESAEEPGVQAEDVKRQEALRALMLDKIDEFIQTHELKVRIPKELLSGEMLTFVPKFLLKNLPKEITIPLTDTAVVSQERGFVKKILIPFLVGLKLSSAMLPLAIALIALKTWKAMTLGLLSLVLSGALVIFRFTKPKVVNYEVYHYPSHAPAPPVEHSYDHHGYGRSGSSLAYRAYQTDETV